MRYLPERRQVGNAYIRGATLSSPEEGHERQVVGIYLFTVTPMDEAANARLIVIVVFDTKYVWVTPLRSTLLTRCRARCSRSSIRLLFTIICSRTPGKTLRLNLFRRAYGMDEH